ncbi:cytochrome c biogenesis protein CcdA [Spirochaetia bacterium 38H-sp]|uniref:Cytochrome c biogenesis protein CcdA n=1 Tax=Rarispira pelagica TaxID=3141764 RepID=A0ABU9UCV9_9SPIR
MSNASILPFSFIGGILSFLSPCILPMVPVYLSLLSGVSVNAVGDEKKKVVLSSVWFILGFSIVFAVLGLLSSVLFFLASGVWINWIAGSLIILFGLHTIFDIFPALNLEKRFSVSGKPASAAGAFILGLAFGAGWSPCVGPILTGILALAGQSGSLVMGFSALMLYALGLGLPFILVAVFFSSAKGILVFFKRHAKYVKVVSGIFLIAVGLIIAFGKTFALNALFTRWSGYIFSFYYDAYNRSPVLVSVVSSVFFLFVPAVLFAVSAVKRIKKAAKNAYDFSFYVISGFAFVFFIGFILAVIGVWDFVSSILFVLSGGVSL